MKYLVIYIVIINLISFMAYGIDKWLAKRKYYRISERELFLFGLFGGSLGSLIGMVVFRHKTKKIKFYIWNIVMILIWLYLVYKLMIGSV